ncbi:MAG: tetratricopeptide repeat protein [marine benthic group bacterium]|nr:tetratricopeptide repeat protein [Gemmatimonadota bacterium]
MAVYGTVAFVLLQLADIAFEPLGLPESAMTFLIVLALFGFPIAVVLAWAFEVTPDGVKKTVDAAPGELTQIIEAPASSRWPAGLLALFGVAALVWGAWFVGKRAGASEVAGEPGQLAEVGVADPDQPAGGAQLSYADLSADSRPSIAVLPFADMSREGDQEYFSDGMTEEILNVLARIPDLRVAARTTAFAYKGQDPDLREVGEDLGVRYVLEGSVRKAGDDLRITAQLIDTQDNFHVWSDSYDRRLDNVFEIQSEIAESIAEALKVPLGVDEKADLVIPTGDMAAYDLYLEARARIRDRGAENIADAIGLYEAAIARDSAWAPAWAGLAIAHTVAPFYPAGADGPDPDPEIWNRALTDAESAAVQALQYDPDNASARVALGNVYRYRGEWDRAEAAFLEALAADPDNVEAHQQYAELLVSVGRQGEALAVSARAVALDRSAIRLANHAATALQNGRLEEAIELAEEGMDRDPEANVNLLDFILGNAYLQLGRYDDVRKLLETRGERENLRAALVALESREPEFTAGITPPAFRMEVLMMMGERERALEVLEGHVVQPPLTAQGNLFGPWADPIRADPRVQAVLAQMGLAGVEPVRSPPPEESGSS